MLEGRVCRLIMEQPLANIGGSVVRMTFLDTITSAHVVWSGVMSLCLYRDYVMHWTLCTMPEYLIPGRR